MKCYKKLVAFIVVFALLFSSTSYYKAKIEAATTYGNIIVDDFESGINGWGPRGTDAEVVELSTEQSNSGKYSVKVSNRTKTWHGATVDKTSELTKGETYVFSIYVKYVGDSYSGTQNFSLQLQYNDGVNDQYKTIKTAAVTKGNWTQLTGEYTIPTDSTNVQIYVETQWKSSPSTQDLMNFYIDDFTATPAVLPEIEQNIASLKDVYSGYFKIGCGALASEIAPKPGNNLALKHYNSLTLGNELKPDSVLDYNATAAYVTANPSDQTNPQISLRAAKTLLEFARDNKIPVRGHTLVWHNQTPDWFFRENFSQDTTAAWASKEVMLERLKNYIKNVMELLKKDYPTVEFYAWDVVNEAVNPNNSDGMRSPGSNYTTSGNSLWMQTVGKDYIQKAFEYAREYAPTNCKLYYNDYNEYETTKMNFIYNILKDLKAKNLVDGMGMQSHVLMSYPSVSMIETAIRKYSSLGLDIQLTELDVKQPDNSTTALADQATRYKAIMNKVTSLKQEGINITAVVFWGITDKTSWLGGYPLLFDKDYKAKPAYYSIIDGVVPISTTTPTTTPTTQPTATPTVAPTATPTATPIVTPTPTPVITPTVPPTQTPVPGQAVPSVTVTTTNNQNSITQKYTITAVGGTIDLSKVSIKFTATGMSTAAQNVWCDQAALQLNIAPYYSALSGMVTGQVTNGSLYLTLNKSVQLTEGTGKFIADIRFAKTDWSAYGTLSNPVLNFYYDGTQIQ